MIGGLLGAGGQVLGAAIPTFGAARGVAGATGLSGALGGSGNPVGSMLGSALGAPQQSAPPQAPPPALGFGGPSATAGTPPMAGAVWDPITRTWRMPVEG
jgi:hypothetical protein